VAESEHREQFAQLVSLHQSQVFGFIRAMTRNTEDAQDLHQQTLIVLWKKFDKFEADSNFLAWALRVADLEVRHFHSRRKRSATDLSEDIMSQVATALHHEAELGELDTRKSALSGCMDKLSDGDRQMIERIYVEEHRIKQVAAEMDRLPQSVSNSLRRIRQGLFECIESALAREEKRP